MLYTRCKAINENFRSRASVDFPRAQKLLSTYGLSNMPTGKSVRSEYHEYRVVKFASFAIENGIDLSLLRDPQAASSQKG